MADTATGLTTPTVGGTTSQGLSSWAAPYITDYLGKAQALANTPYQTYQGPLTAGPSDLQTQAFQGIGSLSVPNGGTYNPVGSNFTSQQAQQYMNPYLEQALNPTLDEIRRQSQITQQQNNAKMTQAGAFGGSRQALMDTETQRNLLSQLAKTTGEGYASAYDKAAQQFNTDQQRKINEAQFGADYALKGLGAEQDILKSQLGAGETQRGIASEGITADLNEFNQQRQFPYQQLEFQRNMISGLPASAVSSTPAPLTGIAALMSALGGVGMLDKSGGLDQLSGLLSNLGYSGTSGATA